MNDVKQQLDQLYLAEQEYEAAEANLNREWQMKIMSLLGDDLFYRMQEIGEHYGALLDQANSDRERVVKELQASIKTAAVEVGETVKANHYMAVFTQPKPTWDSGKLEGYAAAHPEILAFRTEKNPYVSIRKVK